MGPEDFPTLLAVLAEQHAGAAVHLDEVQEAPEWQRLGVCAEGAAAKQYEEKVVACSLFSVQ